MTDLDEATAPVDGRVARRQRNIDAVLDVVVEMFGEDAMFPTIEQVSIRSGLSLRSLYRYFADPGELLEAAIKRTARVGREIGQLDTPRDAPFDRRLSEFLATRLRVHEAFGAVHRASIANAGRHPKVRDQLTRDRNDMRAQFELQFAPELATRRGSDRDAVVATCDLLTQLASIDYLRRHRQLTVAETQEALSASLRALLT